MKAAILCPGPSLKKLGQIPPGYDATWAVNTAIKMHKTDWLGAGDIPLFRGLLGDFRPKTGVLTMGATAKKAKTLPDWMYVETWVEWSDVHLIKEHEKRGRPINWGIQAALCHAYELGAKEIDIYGCDLAGVEDATGYGGEERTEDRWQREARDLQFTRDLLHSMGIQTTRIHL